MTFAALAMVDAHAATGRFALVVGNSNYQHHGRLANPHNDASDIAATLRGLDFEVLQALDVGRNAFQEKLREFDEMAYGSEMAVVFYAGHGLEVDKYNYLIPVDARLADVRAVKHETVPLSLVMDSVAGAAGLGVVILDACRDNPLPDMRMNSTTRSIGRGLAPTDVAAGTLVHYAAKDGTTAADGDGRNSPYTAALLRYLNEPGIEVGMMFRKVRDAVMDATKTRQQPFQYGSLPARPFYFNPGAVVPAATEPTQTLASAIDLLLGQAETNLAIDRLTRPADDNAVDKFRRVLALDPDNTRASEGLRKVASRYVVLIEHAIDDGAPDRARGLVSGLAAISPEHPDLADISRRIAGLQAAGDPVVSSPVPTSPGTTVAAPQPAVLVLDDEDEVWDAVKNDCGEDANGEPGRGPSRYLRSYPGGRHEGAALARLLECRVAQ